MNRAEAEKVEAIRVKIAVLLQEEDFRFALVAVTQLMIQMHVLISNDKADAEEGAMKLMRGIQIEIDKRFGNSVNRPN